MYKFVDTVTGSAKSSPMSLQTVFNGINLDSELTDEKGSFVTLTVSGRGILSKRINTFETPYKHGNREGSYTYAAREIHVKFKLEDNTNEGFRDRFNQLSFALSSSKKELKFTDEDAYFYATLESCDLPEEDSNEVVGTLIFICSDPAKYKAERTVNVTTSLASHTITSQSDTTWASRTVFSAAGTNYTIENDKGGKIVLNYNFSAGDIVEIDYEKRLIKLNGVAHMTLLSLASKWFKLQPGVNRLKASRATTITYRETFY